jgi:O-antigen ligase
MLRNSLMIITKTLKIKNIIQDGWLSFFCCLLSVIILPAYVHYLPPIMILWGLAWLIENKLTFTGKMFINKNATILFFLFIILYLWQICGLFLADSLNSGFERIFKRLSFLLFPLVLFYPGDRIIRNIKIITRVFAIATLGYAIYCLGNAFYESLAFSNGTWLFNPHPPIYDYENYFYSYRLSEPVHPSYMSIYIVLSLLVSLESLFDKSLKLIRRILWSIVIAVLLIVLYLLSSRAGFLAACIAIPVFLLIKLYNRLPRIVTIVLVIGLAASFVFVARKNTRINYFLESISSEKISEVLEKDIRYTLWKSAFNIIKENTLLGVGTGDASNELKKEFTSNGYVDGFYENLNVHNQYFEILLENGIIGLAIFLSLLGFMIYIAIKQRNLIYGAFILIMMISFVFETVLNRLAGITFFPLFAFLLYYYPYGKSKI